MSKCYIGKEPDDCERTNITCKDCTIIFNEGVEAERLRTKKEIDSLIIWLNEGLDDESSFFY